MLPKTPHVKTCREPLLQDAERTFGSGCCRSGLKALRGEHSNLIRPENTRFVLGSVDIENYVKEKDKHRKLSRVPPYWDYLIGYHPGNQGIPRAYFVEVHPAAKREDLEEMQDKLDWLKKRLEGSPFLCGYWNCSYHWVVQSDSKVSFDKLGVLRATKGTLQLEGRGPLMLK